MKIWTSVRAIFVVSFLCSCVSAPPNTPIPRPASSDAANLYLLRSDGFMRMADPASIYVDGRHIGQITANTYMKVEVAPGEIAIGMYAEGNIEHSILVRPQDELCYSFERNAGELALNSVIGGISTSIAKRFVLKEVSCKRFKKNIAKYTKMIVAYELN